jgi:hypothetical protein
MSIKHLTTTLIVTQGKDGNKNRKNGRTKMMTMAMTTRTLRSQEKKKEKDWL